MDCDLTRQELIAFYFGEIDDQMRERLESHLFSCPDCVREFLLLKRFIEMNEAKPSGAAKKHLREAVAREVVARTLTRWSWWQRPLAVVMATAAVVLALFAVNILSASPGRAPHAWSKHDQQSSP